MEFLFSSEIILSFITLSFLEIILGIDNLIFIAIVVSNLPAKYRDKARYIGIALALIIRIIMLFALSWVMTLTTPLFTAFKTEFSYKSLLLIIGGAFLIIKSGIEIYSDIKKHSQVQKDAKQIAIKSTFFGAIIQIAAIDFVFSFDSIITAIGMTSNIPVIVAAVVLAMMVMLFASQRVVKILQDYPSLKIVALAFIFMIGVILLADGFNFEISKGYLYFSLFFAMAVEYLNIAAGASSNKK
jgi:predicted tellurium resistance membrane protein TerC